VPTLQNHSANSHPHGRLARAGRTRALLVALTVGALVVAAMSPATGHRSTQQDGNDPGVLDIRAASFNHKNGTVKISQTSDESWGPSLLGVDDGGSNDTALLFQFESRGNDYTDFVVLVDYIHGELRAQLRKWVPQGEQTSKSVFVSRVKVRKSGRTVIVRFRMNKLDPRDSHIGWSAQSLFKDDTDCSSTCKDYAPNNRYVYNHFL
jgi:hypothetical protein